MPNMVRGTVFCVGAYIFMGHKLVCLECGKDFFVTKNRFLKAKFCSIYCSNRHKEYKIIEGVKINYLTSIREVESEVKYSKGKK